MLVYCSISVQEENGYFDADPEWLIHAESAMDQYEEQSA